MSTKERGDARGEPQINRDHYGVCYVIVGNDGEPMHGEFIFDDVEKARDRRDSTAGWKHCRIVECGYRVFADEPTIADDPRPDPATSRNVNCLDGIRCPKCGQEGSFRIAGSTVFEVVDDGTVGHGDVEWDDDSWTLCPACEHEGKLGEFSRK